MTSLIIEDLSIAGAAAQLVLFDEHLKAGCDLTVEVMQGARIDAIGLQLLVAAYRTATAMGGQLTIPVPPVGPLAEALRQYAFMDASDALLEPFHYKSPGAIQ